MDIQRLRNLTTGRLHTKIECVYQDIEFFTRTAGIMTHMIPNAFRALEPFLKDQFKDERLWDGKYDKSHTGEIDARPMTNEESKDFWDRYRQLPNPLLK